MTTTGPGPWRWPDDYVPLDGGRMRVRSDLVPTFESWGWTTLRAVMETERCQVMRRVGERENCRLDLPLPGQPGPSSLRAHLKRHWSRGPAGWLAARLSGRRWVPPGLAEAEAAAACQRAGVATMTILAAGTQPGRWAWQADSFLLTEELPGRPADDFWQDRVAPAEDPQVRSNLLAVLADTARRLHAARLFHRDLYWCHFFVHETEPARFAVALIDLQRVCRSRVLAWRWQLKDLAQFVFSVPEGCLSLEERMHWFRRYRQVEALSAADRLWFRLIGLRAWLYRWKEDRRCGSRW